MSTKAAQQKADFDQLIVYSKNGIIPSLVAESSGDAINTKTLAGIITSWNKGSEKIYGYKASEVIGKNISELTAPKHINELVDLLKKVGAGHTISHHQTQRIRKDGTFIDVSLSLSPIKDEKRKVIGVACLSRDITESKRIHDERNMFLNLSADIVCIAGVDGYFKSVNQAFEKTLGFTEKELRAKPILNFVHPDDRNSTLKEMDNISRGDVTINFVNRYRCKDGTYKMLKWKSAAIGESVYAIARDITPLKFDELSVANRELAFQDKEKGKREAELFIANKELVFQNEEKEKRANELNIANVELAFQDREKEKRADELVIANEELVFQNAEKEKRANELSIANVELAFQDKEKGKRADELIIANKELVFQNEEKEKRANELSIANVELAFQNTEKEKRANELSIANMELAFQNNEKEKRANELGIANIELAFQNEEKEKRANELSIANIELAFQNEEKEKRANELSIANIELAFQNEEKEKRANELGIANKELAFQNEEKEKRAAELIIANKELVFQNEEKEKRADELVIANKELIFQNEEKEKRAAELVIADKELDFQNKEKDKRKIENRELEAFSNSQKQASQYARSLIEASTDPLVTISPEGKITDVNEASVKVTGETREKLIGTDFSNYFTEPEKAREGYKQVFEKGLVADYPLTIHHKNGTLTDVLYNASVYKDIEGKVLGVFAAARDVTAQKILERGIAEREKELERLVELERFRKLTVGRELKMIELKKENESLREKLGITNEEFV